jgi:hypothetical protein
VRPIACQPWGYIAGLKYASNVHVLTRMKPVWLIFGVGTQNFSMCIQQVLSE